MTKVRVPALTKDQIAQVRIMSLTMTVKQIGAHFNKSPACIYQALSVPVVEAPKPRRYTQYSDEQKAEMVRLIVNKISTKPEVVAKFNISHAGLAGVLKKAGVYIPAPNVRRENKVKPAQSRHINLTARYSGLAEGMF